MTLPLTRRDAVVTIAALLLVTLTGACGGNAVEVSAPPDRESCQSADSMATSVGILWSQLILAIRRESAPQMERMTTVMAEDADKAMTGSTDPRVKAVVAEYRAAITEMITVVAASSDVSAQVAAVEIAADKFDASQQKLRALCNEPGASTSARQIACDEIKRIMLLDGRKVTGATYGVGLAGEDQAKLDAAVNEVNVAVDRLLARLRDLASRSTEADLKAAVIAFGDEFDQLRNAIAAAAIDPTKRDELVGIAQSGTAEQKISTLCGR